MFSVLAKTSYCSVYLIEIHYSWWLRFIVNITDKLAKLTGKTIPLALLTCKEFIICIEVQKV